jgi:hypothetical protein
MKISPLERARRYIAKCPAAISGQGGHNATFHVAACLVHGFALDEADTLTLLREFNQRCVPPWSAGELVHKIKSAANTVHLLPRGHLLGAGVESQIAKRQSPIAMRLRAEKAAKPLFCPMVLKRIAAKAAGIGDVLAFVNERSPVRVDCQDSASVLRWLFRRGSGEKVVLFNEMKSQGQFVWEADKSDSIQNHHLPAGNDGVWFLPQPVDGEFHPNPRLSGKRSRRSEESVTSWRYAVLESDEADSEDWLRCLVQMPLRIACICESGGRSIHALVRIDAASKADWDAKIATFKPVLVTLGADPGALSAVRLSRLPQAKRGERVQTLLYLNPDPDGRPIGAGVGKAKGIG